MTSTNDGRRLQYSLGELLLTTALLSVGAGVWFVARRYRGGLHELEEFVLICVAGAVAGAGLGVLMRRWWLGAVEGAIVGAMVGIVMTLRPIGV